MANKEFKRAQNLEAISQLDFFQKVIETKQKIAQANTYDTDDYKEALLGAYQDYLDTLTALREARLQHDRALEFNTYE